MGDRELGWMHVTHGEWKGRARIGGDKVKKAKGEEEERLARDHIKSVLPCPGLG